MLFARQALGQGRRAGLAMPGLANGLDLMIWPVAEARAAIGSDTPCSICGDALCTAAAAPVSPQTVYPWSGPFPFASADDDVNPVASLIQHSGPWTWQFPCAVNDRIEVFHAACLLDYLARHFVDDEPVRCLVTGVGGFPNALNWLALGRDLFLSLTLSVGVSDMYQRIKAGADGGDDMYIAMQSELRAAWMLARLMAFQLVPLPSSSSSYNEPLYIHWLLRTAAVGQQWIDHVYDVFVVANDGNGGNTDDDSVDALVLRIMSVVLDMLSAGARPWTDRASGILWRVLQRLAEHGTNVAVVRQLAGVLQQHRHRNNVSFGKSLGADVDGGGDATTLPVETYIAIVEAGRESPALAAAWTDVLREALFNGTFLMPMLMAPGSEFFFHRQPEALMPTNVAILRGLSVARRRQLFLTALCSTLGNAGAGPWLAAWFGVTPPLPDDDDDEAVMALDTCLFELDSDITGILRFLVDAGYLADSRHIGLMLANIITRWQTERIDFFDATPYFEVLLPAAARGAIDVQAYGDLVLRQLGRFVADIEEFSVAQRPGVVAAIADMLRALFRVAYTSSVPQLTQLLRVAERVQGKADTLAIRTLVLEAVQRIRQQ